MLWSLLFILAAGYLGLVVLLFLLQDRLLYLPARSLGAAPEAVGLAYEEVRFEAADGVRLHGWWVPAPDPDAAVVLFFHGNAGNISHRLESLEIFHGLGLTTFIFDYRGYGRSGGKPSERGTYRDAEGAWRHLSAERGIAPARIVLFGRSLGGAVAAWLAARTDPAALILESTFTSVPDLAAKLYPYLPVRLLARLRYDARGYVREAGCPVLVAHSPEDEIVPFEHARALYAAAGEPKRFLRLRGGHNDGFLVSGETYTEGIGAFLDAFVRGPDAARGDPPRRRARAGAREAPGL